MRKCISLESSDELGRLFLSSVRLSHSKQKKFSKIYEIDRKKMARKLKMKSESKGRHEWRGVREEPIAHPSKLFLSKKEISWTLKSTATLGTRNVT